MYGEFSMLQIREDFKIRKGSRIYLVFPGGTIEVKVVKIYMDATSNVWVECENSKGVGAVHSAHNLRGYGQLKKY